MVIASFFTPDGPNARYYVEAAARLTRQCKAVGIQSRIVDRPYLGAWMATIRQKPGVILEALAETCGPVLWMDVDTQLIQYPREAESILERHDIAGIERTQPGAPPFEVFCIGFSGSERSVNLVRRWADLYSTMTDEDLTFREACRGSVFTSGILPMTYRRNCGEPDAIVRMGMARHKEKEDYFVSPEWREAKKAMYGGSIT